MESWLNPIRLLPVLKLWAVVLNQRWFCSWGIWQCQEGCFETAITQDSTHPQIIILPQMLTARTGENTFTSTLLPLHCAYTSLGILIQVQILSMSPSGPKDSAFLALLEVWHYKSWSVGHFLFFFLFNCFCFMFWFFGLKACSVLVPWPGKEPALPVLEGDVLTTGQPGKSCGSLFNKAMVLC